MSSEAIPYKSILKSDKQERIFVRMLINGIIPATIRNHIFPRQQKSHEENFPSSQRKTFLTSKGNISSANKEKCPTLQWEHNIIFLFVWVNKHILI